MEKLQSLQEKLSNLKEELIKAATPKGSSVFNMNHIYEVSKKDHGAAKAHAHSIVDSSTANPKNKARIKNMIDSSKSTTHLVGGMSNHILAHPSEGLKVIKSEQLTFDENGQWSLE